MRYLILNLILLGALTSATALAQSNAIEQIPGTDYKLGRDYFEIKTPAKFDKSDPKIEVVTFFWYGCPTCRSIDRGLTQWMAQQPEDVHALRLPAVFTNNDAWETHARLFFTLDFLGVEKDLHSQVFEAVQPSASDMVPGSHPKPKLLTLEEQTEFAKNHGLDPEQFLAAYNSPEVDFLMKRNKAFMDNANFDGVPAIVVNGRYQHIISQKLGEEGFIDLADKLIDLERKSSTAK